MSWTTRIQAHISPNVADGLTSYDSISTGVSPSAGAAWSAGCNVINMASILSLSGIELPQYVQGAGSASNLPSGTTHTWTQAFSSDNNAGNCIVVDVAFNCSSRFGVTASCTDSRGNTYTQVSFNFVAGSAVFLAQYVATGIAAGANTITITQTGAFDFQNIAVAVHEYSGVAGVVHDSQFSGGANTNTLSLGPLTGSVSGDLLHFAAATYQYCSEPAVTGGGTTIEGAWLVTYELSGSPATGGYYDRSKYLFLGQGANHSFNLQARQRGQASYTMVSDPNNPLSMPANYRPVIGQQIFLFDQNISGPTRVFAGIVQDWTIRQIGIDGAIYIDVTAVSLESVFDTVYCDGLDLFTDEACGDIVTALFNKYETGCPVALGTISAGASVPSFNPQKGQKLSDIVQQLATTSQFTWSVNANTLQLNFCLPSTLAGPFTITSDRSLWDSITLRTDAADYRNRQAVKLSYDAFPHSQEYFAGAGQQSFLLMRPVNQVVTAYITLSTCSTATGSFSGQPSPGDTVTIGPVSGAWQAGHVYGLGGIIVTGGFVFKVTTAGTSGGSMPNFAANTVTGDTVADNSVIWTCQGPSGISTGTSTYTFVSALDNTQYGQVLIGASVGATGQNLVDALNATVIRGSTQLRGVTFSLPTWENSQCNAITFTGTSFTLQQKAAGSGWIASIAATGSAFSWSASQTSGGTSPSGSVGPNEGATITIQVYPLGTSTAAPGLAYQQGSNAISLATPLNFGTNLNVEYTRSDGDVIEVEDTSLVTALALVSGGTGKYQQITDQSSTGLISTSAASGLRFAQETLEAYNVPPTEFTVRILQPGILPDQEIIVALAGALSFLNGTYFVEEVVGELIPTFPYLDSAQVPGGGHYRYSLKLIDVAQIDSYLGYWLRAGGSSGGGGLGGALVATSGGSSNPQGLPIPQKYSTTFSGVTSVTVTHDLNTTAVLVQCFDNSGNVVIPENVAVTSANVVTLTFGISFTGSVVVIG